MQDWLRGLILAELEAAEATHGGPFPPLPAGMTQLAHTHGLTSQTVIARRLMLLTQGAG